MRNLNLNDLYETYYKLWSKHDVPDRMIVSYRMLDYLKNKLEAKDVTREVAGLLGIRIEVDPAMPDDEIRLKNSLHPDDPRFNTILKIQPCTPTDSPKST